MKKILQKLRAVRQNRGMTYVELIVVLSIFAVVTGIVLLNYQTFQAKVDVKNLANDVALKVVEAQKNSTSGKIPFGDIMGVDPWKPSYGIYINPVPGPNTGSTTLYYFADLDQNKKYDYLYTCPIGECIEKFTLTSGAAMTDIVLHFHNGAPFNVDEGVSVTFTRPDSGATFARDSLGSALNNVDYLEFKIESPEGPSAIIKIFASGRVEII